MLFAVSESVTAIPFARSAISERVTAVSESVTGVSESVTAIAERVTRIPFRFFGTKTGLNGWEVGLFCQKWSGTLAANDFIWTISTQQ
ncbi:MAG: hypothetical protein IPN22_10205 [Bacteroidetes bacterium]|nr:hypothetical protein [Bacteroidota bacterium]